ncbi:sporulation-specific protein 15 isoform X2 [Drosophila pseudoobscura]|nr:sporulation-specific protein 15 isoform X2 [Drosophila pseudoobscura]
MHLALDTTDSTHSDLSSRNDTQLIKFLQTVYPDFAPNLDTSGNLDRSDYFLVYTLMLHYACVIKKSTQYQIKCTELPEHIQKAIASFLSRIVNSHKITRLCLVEALETTKKFFEPAAPPAMVLPYTTSTVRQALMEAAIIPADSEAPGTPVKAITDSPQTPQDTPLHSSRDEYSPLPICSTPMRERERMTVFEWRQVMDKLAATEIKLAELETKLTSAERKLISTENEYSILDELFQEVSKTKVNLQNANKELKAEIEILREKIQIFEERSIDEEADGRSNFEHLKQGYLKEIAAKEAIIAEINEHLQDAISANVKENARVREIEEQLKKCFDQINMLNLTVNQNKAVLRDKDFEISCLERDKQDLAQCLNVLRQESQGRREVLNASSDMLDTSLSPGSVPENLGSCVIEKQLREKDQEICQLKEEFAKLQSDIYKLINAEVKVEPSFKDQTQLLKAICDALIVSPQAAAEYESRKLHNEIEILLAELQSEKDARADMHDPHDKECIQMTCELAFIDEDLDNEKQIVAKQHKRILEAQQRLDSLALTEKYNKQLDELQHQLEILETELPQMASHCVLNYLEDEKASDEMSRQSLEETKRLEQQINSKPDLLKKKESEVAEVKDQIALLQQKMKDEGAKGRLQAPARMAELDQLVKDRKVLAITSREQSQRLAHRHDRLDKLELARKKKEMQIKNENHDPDSEIGRYYARELQELESKCHFTLQKCVQAKAEAAEQADKLSHVLQRLEQIQYQNERSIEVATTKEERAAQKDSDTDLIAEKDAKIVELSVEMMVLTDKLDSLADDRARLKASAKEHRKNASILQKSLDLLSAERSGLAKKLGMQKSLLKMYGKSIQVLLEKQNSQEENEKCYEQKLKKLQEEHSDVIKKLELGIDQWRERYENLENDISAQKEIASTNERKHQDTVQAHARTIAKLRDDYNTLEKDLLHKQNCCEEDRKKLNERVVLLTEERDTLRLHKDILKKELDTLSQERDTLTLCSDTVNQERNNLNALYATLLKERDNLKESNGTLQKERDNLNALYATVVKERNNLKESNGTLQKERDNLNEFYATLLKERDNLNKSKGTLQKEHDNLNELYATLLKERDNLKECNGTLQKERDNLYELYATLLKESDNLNKSNGTLQKERDNLYELYATLLKESDNLNKSKGTLQKEHDNLNELYATLLKERDNLNESNGTLQKERDNLNELYATLQKERDNLNESNGTLQKERDNLNELYATLQKERDNLNESNGTLQKERDNLNELYATLQKERDNLNESNGTLQKERDNLNELYATLLKERDNLNESNGTLQKERDNLNELYATLLKERDNLNESNGTLLIERDNLKVAEQQHQTEISRFVNMEREIWGMLDNTTEKIQALSEINTNENKENRQLHGVSSLRQVNCLEMLKEILYQKDMQIEALRKEREMIRKSERATKTTLHMLTKECDAKEARLSQEIGCLNYNLMQAKQLVQQQQLSHDTETQLKIDASQALEAAKQELQEVREQMLKIETEHAHDKQHFELMAQQFQAQHAQILQEKADLQADILKQQDDFRTLEKDLLYKQKCLEEGHQKLYERMLMLKEERNTLTQERDTLKQELDAQNQEHEAFRKERCTLKLYNDTLKQDLISVGKQLKEEVSRQQIETEARAMTEKQLSLVQHQLEQSEQKYARLKIEMTDQQTTSDERQIELSKQLNAAKTELAETMERLSATYTAAAEEEGLPDRTTLQRDCQVLQAKYQEAKKKIDELQVNLKDQRNEMEGKLEKMKNKMRTLYTAEVTRMKEKQEREAAHNKAELEALTSQNNKYEEHTRKLSNQIVRLNERILEQQKQHAITTTKLRHMQATSEATKSSSSLSTLTVAGSATTGAKGTGTGTGTAASATEDWQPFKRPSAPSSNLAMEDEEGEVFNNTYLTDLKLGRVPDITAEELNYRNSLQPPHLRSTYAAQYDVGSQDEDPKDGPHSLDDSMSALLSSSTSTGARKKSMGTHYKRPGPPTPSKNGGRLSFGSSEPPREILRETCENTGTSKTPTRFKMFTSRFSIGSTTSGSSGLPRDERPLRRERPNLLTGMQRRRLQLRQSSGLFCTSTPRKSRSYYDQRRLICASDAISDHEEDEEEVEQEGNEQEPEQEQENVAEELEEEGTPHLSNAALLAITRGVTRRLSNDPRYSSPSSGSTPQFGGGKRKYRKGRVSLCLHGNIFARSRPLTKNTAAAHAGNLKQQREKLKQQRLNRFDQGRHFNESPVPAVTFQQSPIADNLLRQHQAPTNVTYKLLQPLDRCANNNYSQHNRNKEQQQQQDQQLLLMMGQTVVLRPEDQILDDGLLPVAATTFNVSETDSTDMWQHRQGFEGENIQAWLTEYARERETPIEMENEDSHGGHFERLCRETESTAPFELQPLHYKEQEEQPKVRSVRLLNITGTTSVCTTNASCATNLTSASSQKSCTIYSLGNIQSEPLPTMTITHVEQRLVHHERRTKTLTLRELWYTFCRLNLPGRLMLSLALALTMMLCSQVADRMALGVTAAFGLLLLVLSLSCGK